MNFLLLEDHPIFRLGVYGIVRNEWRSGLEIASTVLTEARGSPILGLTASEENAIAARLFRLGLGGFVSKDLAGSILTQAIGRVLGGKRFITPELADRLVDRLATRSATSLPHESLSPSGISRHADDREGKRPFGNRKFPESLRQDDRHLSSQNHGESGMDQHQ